MGRPPRGPAARPADRASWSIKAKQELEPKWPRATATATTTTTLCEKGDERGERGTIADLDKEAPSVWSMVLANSRQAHRLEDKGAIMHDTADDINENAAASSEKGDERVERAMVGDLGKPCVWNMVLARSRQARRLEDKGPIMHDTATTLMRMRPHHAKKVTEWPRGAQLEIWIRRSPCVSNMSLASSRQAHRLEDRGPIKHDTADGINDNAPASCEKR